MRVPVGIRPKGKMTPADQHPTTQDTSHDVPAHPVALAKPLDAQALSDFRDFLERNKDSLKTGMGAFHHDGHSNW
jgi:hypothetical protein